jgi:NACalpha-BTF3-like transcription factor
MTSSTITSSSIVVIVKHGPTTYHIQLDNHCHVNKSEQFNMIADHIRVPSDRLKLIHKGKRYTRENWHDLSVTSNMMFLSIGEQNEDETNLNVQDIDCIINQLKVDRNTAIRALKLHDNVIDAILYLGNK